jgi:membrane protease YdiL (CAAX protease family)
MNGKSDSQVQQGLNEPSKAELSKLAISLALMFVIYWLCSALVRVLLFKIHSDSHLTMRVGEFVNMGVALLVFIEFITVLWVYRSLFESKDDGSKPPFRAIAALSTVVIGGVTGLVGFLCAIPFLGSIKTELLADTFISPSHSIGLRVILEGLLVLVALPLTAELLFRGVAQRLLARYVSPAAAILVLALLFAGIWPFWGFPLALVLGLLSGVLYWWRRSVLTCIVANIAMTVCAATYVVFRP